MFGYLRLIFYHEKVLRLGMSIDMDFDHKSEVLWCCRYELWVLIGKWLILSGREPPQSVGNILKYGSAWSFASLDKRIVGF